ICLPPHFTLFPYTTLFRSVFDACRDFHVDCFDASTAIDLQRNRNAARRLFERERHRMLDVLPARWRGGATSGSSRSAAHATNSRSEEHTSELQSPYDLVCR